VPIDGLVRGARNGDERSFETLYRRYFRLVHGILLSRLPAGAVDDLSQEVFLLAYSRLASLRDAAAFGSWVAAIARNRAADWLRDRQPFEELPPDLAAPESRAAEAHELLAMIQTLPEAYREPLTLRLVEGLTGPEIALQTGLTPGSVRVNLHRGMSQLREMMGAGR